MFTLMNPPPRQPAFDPALEPAPARRGSKAGHTPPAVRIDIHSHLLPSIDDGCRSFDESLECVKKLKAMGFVGSICTPHLWPEAFPGNTPSHVRAWTERLREDLAHAGVEYHIWPGGELRLFEGVIPWMQTHGVPTLGDSRYVLTDTWDRSWPRFATSVFQWLIQQKYQPILAHPERVPDQRGLDKRIREVEEMGVLLQCNANSFTGAEGLRADQYVRQLVAEKRCSFVALDMHRPETLITRFDGLAMLEAEFGQAALDHLLIDAPRRIVQPV
ncbi:MAG: CpsB/CapC family capsule biosynthesis tyrosine phosphatase [Phycisphaeraceae bacterium]